MRWITPVWRVYILRLTADSGVCSSVPYRTSRRPAGWWEFCCWPGRKSGGRWRPTRRCRPPVGSQPGSGASAGGQCCGVRPQPALRDPTCASIPFIWEWTTLSDQKITSWISICTPLDSQSKTIVPSKMAACSGGMVGGVVNDQERKDKILYYLSLLLLRNNHKVQMCIVYCVFI